MEYQFQAKPAILKNGQKYLILEVTDFMFHTTKIEPTKSTGKKIFEYVRKNLPGRLFSKPPVPPETQGLTQEDKEYVLGLIKHDPEFIKRVQEEESKGYKVLLAFPKSGIPRLLGNDTKQFLASKNGQRIARGLAKENDPD